jgi:hypothetical protein
MDFSIRRRATFLANLGPALLAVFDRPFQSLVLASPILFALRRRIVGPGGASLFFAITCAAEVVSNYFPFFGQKQNTAAEKTQSWWNQLVENRTADTLLIMHQFGTWYFISRAGSLSAILSRTLEKRRFK